MWDSLKSIWGYVAVAVVLSGVIFLLGVEGNLSYVTTLADSWAKPMRLSPQAAPATNQAVLTSGPDAAKRLAEQLTDIDTKGDLYLSLMTYFYTRYYMVIVTSAMCAAAAAGFLFIITANGWKQTNPWVRAVFLTLSVNAAYYAAFPNLFQFQQNIADNKALFIKYAGFDAEMRRYLTTGLDQDGKPVGTPQMVVYFQKSMAASLNVPIGFDSTKLTDIQIKQPK